MSMFHGDEPWTDAETADLKDAVASGLSMSEMAEFFTRTDDDIQTQIEVTGFAPEPVPEAPAVAVGG